MQCRSVENRIQALLDNRLDPSCDSELLDHASICTECRELLEAQRSLFAELPLLATPRLSADFSQRVVGTVVAQRRRPLHRLAPAAAFLAIIATLLLVFTLGPHRKRTADNSQAIASAAMSQSTVLGLSMADLESGEFRLAIEQFVAQLASRDAARFYQVDPLAGTIRPLATTLNVAFDAIRRSIPGRHPSTQPEPQAKVFRDPGAWHVI